MTLNIRKFDKIELANDFKNFTWKVPGKVVNVTGMIIEAILPEIELSHLSQIHVDNKAHPILAQVIGFKGPHALLFPFQDISGIKPGARVVPYIAGNNIGVGSFLLGRVLDPFLNPLDHRSIVRPKQFIPLDNTPPNPLSRSRVETPLCLGVKAIDALLTFGEGQRIGIMAGSGVGKSVLMGMISRGTEADINVIGLIGERGREVREFIECELGEEGLKKSVVIVATSEQSPLMRIRAAKSVTAIAEYFSGQGKKVLLMMDSLTRIAQAQRDIGLAAGELPTTKGYPPSVFRLMPSLLERCGPQGTGHGSISGIYTVLVDGDDFNDPIPDAARSILDGHIVLTRSLANQGHFPAIDINASISRVMSNIVTEQQLRVAQYFKRLMSTYNENLDFIQMGTYQKGADPILDKAIQLRDKLNSFLQQNAQVLFSYQETIDHLVKIFMSEE